MEGLRMIQGEAMEVEQILLLFVEHHPLVLRLLFRVWGLGSTA